MVQYSKSQGAYFDVPVGCSNVESTAKGCDTDELIVCVNFIVVQNSNMMLKTIIHIVFTV